MLEHSLKDCFLHVSVALLWEFHCIKLLHQLSELMGIEKAEVSFRRSCGKERLYGCMFVFICMCLCIYFNSESYDYKRFSSLV